MPAMKMPAIKTTLDATVKSVAENGDITYEVVTGDTTVGDEPGAAPQLAEAIKAAVAGPKERPGPAHVQPRRQQRA